MASRVYSLATPTPGTWYRVQIPADTAALMFKNDSVYDFLLVFGGTLAPNFVTSPGGQANAFVNALEYPVVFVQKAGASSYEQALNGVGAFDGNLWYMAQDNTARLATTGTISGRTVLSIMTYGPLDPVPPSGQAVTRQVDLTSQPRIISVPMTPFATYDWQSNMTAGGDYSPFPAFIAITDPAQDVGCQLYIYYAQVGAWGTDGSMAFTLRLVCRDATNAGIILATVDILHGWCGKTGNVGTPWVFSPTDPYHILAARGNLIPANTGIIEIAIHDYASPAAWPAAAQVLIDSDKITPGLVPVPGIGQGLNPSQYSAGIPKF